MPGRRPHSERPLALILLRRLALEVRQDPRDELGLLDAGDDPQRPAAADAGLDLDARHPLQASRTDHRHPSNGRLDAATSAPYPRIAAMETCGR